MLPPLLLNHEPRRGAIRQLLNPKFRETWVRGRPRADPLSDTRRSGW
jgi:hypothetical protein